MTGESNSAAFGVLRAGAIVKGDRTIRVSEADLDQMVANFRKWQAAGQPVPIDYDHSYKQDRGSRAAGWITDLFRRGSELFARARFTEAACEAILAAEYRGFSPEFSSNWRDEQGRAEGPTLLAGALTNRPHLRGLAPITLTAPATEAVRLTGELGEWVRAATWTATPLSSI